MYLPWFVISLTLYSDP